MKPVWPFLLRLYGDHAGKRLSRHDLLTLTRLVTAYAMRRAVCGYRPAAPPQVFATASRSVDPERYVESVRAYFLCLPEGSAFPSDEAFRAELVSRNMYRFRHRDALLERLENDGRKERVPLSAYTVDHIMPQGERLPEMWKAELGPDWAQTWQSLRHTLGNLTLTAFNPEMGNGSFRDKRDAEKGYRDSPLRLNADLRQSERWDGDAIRARGARLADDAVGIWKRPVLPDRVLEAYRTPRAGAGRYTIEHHPHLRPGAPMHDLFEAVRQEILGARAGGPRRVHEALCRLQDADQLHRHRAAEATAPAHAQHALRRHLRPARACRRRDQSRALGQRRRPGGGG